MFTAGKNCGCRGRGTRRAGCAALFFCAQQSFIGEDDRRSAAPRSAEGAANERRDGFILPLMTQRCAVLLGCMFGRGIKSRRPALLFRDPPRRVARRRLSARIIFIPTYSPPTSESFEVLRHSLKIASPACLCKKCEKMLKKDFTNGGGCVKIP